MIFINQFFEESNFGVTHYNFYECTSIKVDKEKYVVHLERNDSGKAFSVKGF